MVKSFDSSPFDIHKIPLTVIDTEDDYYEFCKIKYFTDCYQKKVLEIGPYHGKHSTKILECQPKFLEIVEGNLDSIKKLQLISTIDKIVHDDILLYLKDYKKFDMVICFGVLYHLHSPLHLLELIVNNCQPDQILLDCVMDPEQLEFVSQPVNIPGCNQTRTNWKSCKFNIVVPFLTYLQAMDNLDYQCTKIDRISVKGFFPKSDSWIATWEKKNDRS